MLHFRAPQKDDGWVGGEGGSLGGRGWRQGLVAV